MKIKGDQRFVKRAVFAACLFNVFDFTLIIEENSHGDSSGLTRVADKVFIMDLEAGLPKRALIQVIAHEVCHLKQYLSGDLEDAEGGTLWKGEFHPEYEHESDEYFLSPWEMEARAVEDWVRYKWENRSELH